MRLAPMCMCGCIGQYAIVPCLFRIACAACACPTMTLCMAFPAGCTLDALIDVEGFDDDDPDPSDQCAASSWSRFFFGVRTEVPSALSLPIRMFFSLRILRRMVEFQRFLIALSVRPGTSLAISAQRFPWIFCASMIRMSSSSDHGPFMMLGSSWLCQRSRICFPVRFGRNDATSTQLLSPCLSTSFRTASSSSGVQGALYSFFAFCLSAASIRPASERFIKFISRISLMCGPPLY
mmetsp:Transcript_39397/g.92728  ORF Transcript_39397/g.92728 Transcript_39397/m.92728 type:complete len:236 (+) Transcript_39397:3-710(+)